MPVTTVYGTGTVTESGTGASWTNLQYAKTSDNLRASTFCLYSFSTWGSCLGKTKLMNVPITTPTLTNGSSVNSISIGVECYKSFLLGNGSVTIYYRYKYNGSWCSSYHSSPVTQSGDLWESSVCTHHAETISGLEAGGLELECYFICSSPSDPTRVYWYVDAVRIVIDYNVATVPSAPADPTLTVQSQSQLTVSSSSPSDGGSALDNVEQQISTSSTFSSGNITWTKGSAPTNPQTHAFTGLTAGTLYYARARYHNSIGWGNYNSSPYNSLYTLCSTPSAPTITANGVGQLNIDWSGNSTTGARTTNAWEIRWSSTGTGDPSTWTLLGNYNLLTTNVNDTGIGNGITRYYAVALYNINGNISSWSPIGNGTTWNVPDSQDLISVTNPSPQTLRITRNSTYPNGNGEPVDSWSVWRSTSEFGTYTQQASGLTSTTWDDSGLSAYQQYWYKAKFTNLVGDSALSPNALSGQANPTEIYVPTNLRVKLIQQNIIPTNLKIKVTQQTTIPTNLKIKLIQQNIISTNLRINVTQQNVIPTNLRIKLTQQNIIPTNLRIKLTQQNIISTNLKISGTQQISISTNLRVSILWNVGFTPSITFDRYEKNYVTTPTIDSNLDLGIYEGVKTLNAIAVDPYENSMTSSDRHEFFYTVDPDTGTEWKYMTPITNGLLTIDQPTKETVYEVGFRGFDIENMKTWNVGITSIPVLFDIEGSMAGSGSKIQLTGTWANTGTVWSPPSSSGSNVYDVPSSYMGSTLVMTDPSGWDQNPNHKLYNWLPFQVCVGHAVEVSQYNMISGTHENNTIRLQGNLNTHYNITLKTYHEYPKEWEWYSGTTLKDNGVLTPIKNTWQFINLSLGRTHLSGSTEFTLKLYARSGAIQYSDSIRTISVFKII